MILIKCKRLDSGDEIDLQKELSIANGQLAAKMANVDKFQLPVVYSTLTRTLVMKTS